MSSRFLIINADDFGVCPATNDAIEQIFNEGILSSTTLMTPCAAAENAIQRVRSNPKIRMGLHITTTSEWACKWGPVAPLESVKTIADRDGHMYAAVKEFAEHANSVEVAAEMEAQYQFMKTRGVPPTHADSHMGSLYGLTGVSFMKETLEFCAEKKLAFRFPKNITGAKGIIRIETLPEPLAAMHKQALVYAKILGVPLIDNLFTSTAAFSDLTSYEKLQHVYFDIIDNLPEGISEIYMHPSLEYSPFAKDNPDRWRVRIWEHRLLLDISFRKHIESEDIMLVNYQTAPFGKA